MQLPLPIIQFLQTIPDCIESMSRQVGLLVARCLIEEEVKQLAVECHAHDAATIRIAGHASTAKCAYFQIGTCRKESRS